MGLRRTKPKGKVKIKWSPGFAYAIGLLVTDGCLLNDGRHMDLTTKDIEQAETFKRCLGLKVKIGRKSNGRSRDKKYFRVQFGDVLFYRFLEGIGLMPAKSKVIRKIEIPNEYFFDFLRGHSDGDGTFFSYMDPRWRSSFSFYAVFMSGSSEHIKWLRQEIKKRIGVWGHTTQAGSVCQLKYAKQESLRVLRKMYYSKKVTCLARKRLKIEKALDIVGLKL